MPVFFIERGALQGKTVSLSGPLARHLKGSLRVRPGEHVWLAEAGGPRYEVRITAADHDRLTGQVLSTLPSPPPPLPRITVGLALIKGDGMDWAIQKATELGAEHIVPLVTARTVVRPKAARASQQARRWQNIALEAAQQSMRWDVPAVAEPTSFDAWCAESAATACRLILWEKPGGRSLGDRLRGTPRPASLALAIGPEGGFEPGEVDLAERRGFEAVSLGARILRSESAVLATLAIAQYEWGELG
ncbi:MAG: 16S rRNA (uracil(1498)-N(3))-methyltransferase [Nitrospirae bacterium]|nr:MAG: 16S rRNA (uracil(1498)-N(3))-methyltransferase [Nitrospirota bacterium]